MKTIYQLQQIADRLRAVTEVNSISPEDTFGLQADVLEYLADMEQNAEGLGIHKVYASYAMMVEDGANPVGTNGKYLRFGQLVAIWNPSDPTQSENGNVYAWQKGNTGDSAWLLMGNLCSLDMVNGRITEIAGAVKLNSDAIKSNGDAVRVLSERVERSVRFSELGSYFTSDEFMDCVRSGDVSVYGRWKVRDVYGGIDVVVGVVDVFVDSMLHCLTQRLLTNMVVNDSGELDGNIHKHSLHEYYRLYNLSWTGGKLPDGSPWPLNSWSSWKDDLSEVLSLVEELSSNLPRVINKTVSSSDVRLALSNGEEDLGPDTIIEAATPEKAGVMSAEDKTKLDNAFSIKALQKAELTDLSSDNNFFASSVDADGNLQIKKNCGFGYNALCKVATTSLETGKAYKAVVIYKSPDSSFTLSNGGQSLLQIECPRSEDWNQIEFEFLNFYNRIEFQGLANVFPQYSIVTFKSIEFYSYGRDNVELFTLADEVDEVKNDISDEDWQDITPLCAARRYESVTVGSALPSATNGGNYLCAELDVKEGERYKLTTYSSYNKYPLIFVDKDNIVIKYVTDYQAASKITEYDGTGFEFSIPKDCVKIITHYDAIIHTGVTFKLMKASRFYVESINNKYKDANKYLWERSYPFSKGSNYKGVLCGEIGTFIKQSSTYTMCTDIISCSEGDVFHIRTYPHYGTIYMFFDENNRCIDGKGNIRVYPAPPMFFDDYVVAPKNATKLVVNGRSKVNNYTGEEDSITDIFVIKCVKNNEPIILRNTEAIGAITSATKKFVKNNGLINQWDGYFCIAHISDVHADPVRYKRFRTFVDNVYSIDTAISTGDLVSFHNNDATKMQIEHERMFAIGGEKDVMIVVGNHEKMGAGNTLYTEQQIKDYSGLENLYYYKDWTKTGDLAYKVRVIVLNQHDYDGTAIDIAGRTHYSQEQINWFIDTLKEASNDGRAVMVAMHKTDKFVQPTNNDYGFNCNFPSLSLDTNQSGYIIEDIIDAFKNGTHLTESYTWADNSQTIDVDADFSGKKGSFIAYMCGHNHRDQVGYSPQHPNQLYLCIASGCLQQMYAEYGKGNYGEQNSDLSRVIGTKSEDCFNVYGIDFDNKTVRIVRVGADVTCNMKSRKYLELPWSPS